MSWRPENPLVFPFRGDFERDDDAHRANVARMEAWANSAKDGVMLIDHEELPPAGAWPHGSVILVGGEYYRRVGDVRHDTEAWAPLIPTNRQLYVVTWSLTGNLVVGIRPHRLPIIKPGWIEEVQATVDTASTSGAITVNLLNNQVSMLDVTQIVIAQGLKQSPPTPVVKQRVHKKDEVQVEIVGAGTGAKNLVVSATVRAEV